MPTPALPCKQGSPWEGAQSQPAWCSCDPTVPKPKSHHIISCYSQWKWGSPRRMGHRFPWAAAGVHSGLSKRRQTWNSLSKGADQGLVGSTWSLERKRRNGAWTPALQSPSWGHAPAGGRCCPLGLVSGVLADAQGLCDLHPRVSCGCGSCHHGVLALSQQAAGDTRPQDRRGPWSPSGCSSQAAQETWALRSPQDLSETPAPLGEAAHPTDTTTGKEEVEKRHPDGKVGVPLSLNHTPVLCTPVPCSPVPVAWGQPRGHRAELEPCAQPVHLQWAKPHASERRGSPLPPHPPLGVPVFQKDPSSGPLLLTPEDCRGREPRGPVAVRGLWLSPAPGSGLSPGPGGARSSSLTSFDVFWPEDRGTFALASGQNLWGLDVECWCCGLESLRAPVYLWSLGASGTRTHWCASLPAQ